MEACVVKPGLIYADWKPLQNPEVAKWIGSIDVAEVAVAMLRQIIHGIEKEPLTNDDLVRIGRDALAQN